MMIARNRVTRRRPIRRQQASGFTLIELLLVMVILAILAAVIVPKFTGRTNQAKVSAATTDISNLKTTISAFEVDTGSYPQSLNDLVTNPGNITGWHGPYIEKLPNDPWGHPYIYHPPGGEGGSDFQVLSAGPDGQEGTADDIPPKTQ
jgi:general secretion pathway protein G